MKNNNYQQKVWENDFGKKYTLRSTSYSNWVKVYKERFNLTKEQINSNFLKKIPKSSKILEVGCNIGNQLKCLYKMGYKNLYGVDVQKRCIIEIKNKKKFIKSFVASAYNLPFDDNYFDLVFTSNVLIHIPPKKLNSAVDEIIRTSSKWIWGFEYYSKKYKKVIYRNHDNLLWKGDFSKFFTKKKNLKIIKEKLFRSLLVKKEIDKMYLIKKI